MKDAWKTKYENLWATMEIKALNKALPIVNKITTNKERYESIAKKVNLPWYMIAAIHSLEGSLDFTTHLHNGDSLKARTKNVPKNRPVSGNPPFTWEESALDALRDKINYWSRYYEQDLKECRSENVINILFLLETYNGLGYLNYYPNVNSPYLWSGTNHYTKGKYASDGKYDPELVSSQIGCAVLIKLILESAILVDKPIIFAGAPQDTIKKLQGFMNQFVSEKLTEDGKVGPKTKAAYKKVFGTELV